MSVSVETCMWLCSMAAVAGMSVAVVFMMMLMSVVSAFAGVGAGGDAAVEPGLDQSVWFGCWQAGDHLDAEFGHAHLRATTHAADEDGVDLLRAEPGGPFARFRSGWHDLGCAQDHALGGIDLVETHFGGAAVMEGKRAVFGEWNGDVHRKIRCWAVVLAEL